MTTQAPTTVVRTRIQPRFSDFDSLGHLNNAKYLEYVEVARIHTFAEVLGVDLREISAVISNANISFLRPIRFFDNLVLETAITNVQKRSIDFRITFRTENSDQSPKAIVEATQVIVDVRSGKVSIVPEELADRITQLVTGQYRPASQANPSFQGP